jgi:ubiquinone/menaquinone biosynthesis C-methylase UbiE
MMKYNHFLASLLSCHSQERTLGQKKFLQRLELFEASREEHAVEGQHRFHHHNEAERRKWQDPEEILSGIGLKEGDTFLDMGCGDGFFTLPAARIVGPGGLVHGLDPDSVALDELREKASREDLGNIRLQVGRAEELVLCDGCADVVFFGIDLHDFQDQQAVLANALKMLKPTGLLVDLDWKKEPTPIGPPLQIRFSPRQASVMIQDAGFTVVSVEDSGTWHYLIKARPAGGIENPGAKT